MPAMNRRGMTLLELIAALALFSVVAGAAFSTLVLNQRTHAALRQQMDLQQNLRAASMLLPVELRELNAADGDITAMSATSLSIRAMRRMAFLCSPPVLGGGGGPALTNLVTTVRLTPLFGSRRFAVNDSLLTFYEGDTEIRTDDAWLVGKVTAVANVNCPDGSSGQKLTFDMNLGASPNVAGAITSGAPIRSFDRVRYYAYQNATDNNRYYVGLETAAGTQPLVGPLDGNNALTMSYYTAAGAVTAVPANVALIEVRVRGASSKPVRQSSGSTASLVDSVVTRIALRNNRRF